MPHHDHHEHGHHHEHEDRLTAADRREILSLLRDGCVIVRDVFRPGHGHGHHHHDHRPSVVQVTVALGQHRPKQGTHAMTTTNVNIPSPPPAFDSTQEFDVSLTFTDPNGLVLPQQSAIDWESTDPSVADVTPSTADGEFAKATVRGISSTGGTASINFGVDLLVDGKTYRATGSFPVAVAAASTGTETVNVGVTFSEVRLKTGT